MFFIGTRTTATDILLLATEGAWLNGPRGGNHATRGRRIAFGRRSRSGSSWPPWLGEYQKQAPNSVVIAQSAEESASAFTLRIARRVDEISAQDSVIHVALLVSNGALDDATVIARKAMCGALLRAMVQRRHGELVLAAHGTRATNCAMSCSRWRVLCAMTSAAPK